MKKKIIIIASIVTGVLLLLALGIFLFFFFRGNSKITITFDPNGGTKVNSIVFKKGETVELPTTTREGYDFAGWYDENKVQVTSNLTKYIKKSLTLQARWSELSGERITITFDADGGLEVESIQIVKGIAAELPSTTKEGFDFDGWYKDDTKITKENIAELQEDTTLKAKWTEIKSTDKTMTIYFDSKDGKISGNNSKTSQTVVKCTNDSYTVEGLPTATKDGYEFVSWADKNGKVILSGVKLSCEDIKLYANWNKKETKTEEKWVCESGDGPDANHKCKLYMTPDKRCPSNTVEVKGSCINKENVVAGQTNQDKIVRTCGKSTVIMDNNGHTAEVQGTLTYVGDEGNPQYWYCAYGATDESQYECTSHGHKWVGRLNKCYRSTGNPGANITYTCSQNNLIYLSTAEVNSLRQNANISGCFKTTARESYCSDSSYTLNGEYCIKYVDAKKSN